MFISQPLTQTNDNTVILPTSGAVENGRIAELHAVSIEAATAWVQTSRTVRFQIVINGGDDGNHGRVLSTHDTLEDAEQAASALQAETRNANPGGSAFLDLRIDAVDVGVPSGLPFIEKQKMTKTQAIQIIVENVSFWVTEEQRLGAEIGAEIVFSCMDEFGDEAANLLYAFSVLHLSVTRGLRTMNAIARAMVRERSSSFGEEGQ